jgi:hypothetical protein
VGFGLFDGELSAGGVNGRQLADSRLRKDEAGGQ